MTRKHKKVVKTFKDYLVPIAGVFIIIIFIVMFFNSSDVQIDENAENKVGLMVSLNPMDSDASIIYSGDNRQKIESQATIYKGESVIVKDGAIDISLANDSGSISLNKLGELKYSEDGSWILGTSDVWINTKTPMTIKMRYGTVSLDADSVASMKQNEVYSSVYLVKGIANVKNNAGKSTTLGNGQTLSIMKNEANSTEITLADYRKEIDDLFTTSVWFIRNKGESFLGTDEEETATGSTDKKNYIAINSIEDEGQYNEKIININGVIENKNVSEIIFNGLGAELDEEKTKFEGKDFEIPNRVNDIIYKIYDEDRELLEKGVITLYNLGGTSNIGTAGLTVENTPLDSPDFKFISPKDNPYTTTTNVVMIEGTVPARQVEKIMVNGFQLQQFPKYGSYWKYYANAEYGNLKDGMNTYKVEYYGEGGKLLYSNAFYIIKKIEEAEVEVEVENNN